MLPLYIDCVECFFILENFISHRRSVVIESSHHSFPCANVACGQGWVWRPPRYVSGGVKGSSRRVCCRFVLDTSTKQSQRVRGAVGEQGIDWQRVCCFSSLFLFIVAKLKSASVRYIVVIQGALFSFSKYNPSFFCM